MIARIRAAVGAILRIGDLLATTAELRKRLGALQKQLVRQARAIERLERHILERYDEHLVAIDHPRVRLRRQEARVHSQNGEDGLLMHVFSAIGVESGSFIEIGIQDGRECNCANFALNFGWRGLMLEGDPELAASAAQYYADRAANEGAGQVTVCNAFVTAESVDETISREGWTGQIDLLSIDIDGVDFWIWRALTCVAPRVVIIEYNGYLPPEVPRVVSYDPQFRRYEKHESGYYFGASLSAYVALAVQRGFVLVGCDSAGANAIFVQKGLAQTAGLQALTAVDAYYPLAGKAAHSVAFPEIAHLPFVNPELP